MRTANPGTHRADPHDHGSGGERLPQDATTMTLPSAIMLAEPLLTACGHSEKARLLAIVDPQAPPPDHQPVMRFQVDQLPEELLAEQLVTLLGVPALMALAATSKLMRSVVAAAPVCLRLQNVSIGCPDRWSRLLQTLAARCCAATSLELALCDIPSCAVRRLAAGGAGPSGTPTELFPVLDKLSLVKCYHIKSEPRQISSPTTVAELELDMDVLGLDLGLPRASADGELRRPPPAELVLCGLG